MEVLSGELRCVTTFTCRWFSFSHPSMLCTTFIPRCHRTVIVALHTHPLIFYYLALPSITHHGLTSVAALSTMYTSQSLGPLLSLFLCSPIRHGSPPFTHQHLDTPPYSSQIPLTHCITADSSASLNFELVRFRDHVMSVRPEPHQPSANTLKGTSFGCLGLVTTQVGGPLATHSTDASVP